MKITALLRSLIAALCAATPAVFAGQGAASYLDFDGTNPGFVPLAGWTILGTNVFDGSGNFLFTSGATNAMQFFAVQAL